MSYSTINMPHSAPVQGSSMAGALMGAAIGAVVGAVVLAAVVTVDSKLYAPAATTVRPVAAVVAGMPMNAAVSQNRVASGAVYASTQRSAVPVDQTVAQVPQGISVYSWTWVIFAGIAGAINGLFLWNNRRVAMASTMGRREALMAGAAAAGMAAGPAFAAYGDAANVFGKSKPTEQFFTVDTPSWSALIPGKYNPSKEKEAPGQVARWEDNFDAVNNSYVVERQAGKNSVTELGDLDSVRNSVIAPLLGTQTYDIVSLSEGGFAPGKYAAAAVLDQKQETKDGKTYYTYEILTRSADGNEGGRHQLFTVAASNGKLFIFKSQGGDKRWFKGLEKGIRQSIAAFKVK